MARCDSTVHNGASHTPQGREWGDWLKLRQSGRLYEESRNASPISSGATCPHKQTDAVQKDLMLKRGTNQISDSGNMSFGLGSYFVSLGFLF